MAFQFTSSDVGYDCIKITLDLVGTKSYLIFVHLVDERRGGPRPENQLCFWEWRIRHDCLHLVDEIDAEQFLKETLVTGRLCVRRFFGLKMERWPPCCTTTMWCQQQIYDLMFDSFRLLPSFIALITICIN